MSTVLTQEEIPEEGGKKSEAKVFALNNLPVLGFLMSFQIQGTFGPLRERKTIH